MMMKVMESTASLGGEEASGAASDSSYESLEIQIDREVSIL